jgi:hypothetical protein
MEFMKEADEEDDEGVGGPEKMVEAGDEDEPAVSIVQEKLQPSPSARFPSSHCSTLVRYPSPQTETQLLGLPEQVNPRSLVQEELHPS